MRTCWHRAYGVEGGVLFLNQIAVRSRSMQYLWMRCAIPPIGALQLPSREGESVHAHRTQSGAWTDGHGKTSSPIASKAAGGVIVVIMPQAYSTGLETYKKWLAANSARTFVKLIIN